MGKVIGQRIKERRMTLKLTQSQIAERTGLSTSQICYLESGRRRPSVDVLISLSEILSCTTDYLLKGCVPSTSEMRLPEHIVEMYLFIDAEEQEEIEILLKAKCRKKKQKQL